MDYIKRKDGIKIVRGWFSVIELNPDILVDSIMALPAADVVEVVRCKDCKYYNPHVSFNCSKNLIDMHPYDFCSRGERETYNE